MTRIWFDEQGKRYEKPTNNGHKAHGRRRRWKRECMVKRARPPKGKKGK